MAHLILLRSSASFVQPTEAIYGEHEKIELAINSRRYEFNGTREGYNIPFATEWHLMEYRVKKEILSEFIRDLSGIILNPEKNKISLWKIMRYNASCDANIGINRGILFVQWILKWLNRMNRILKLHPIQPVPSPASGKINSFSNGWTYTFILGVLPDVETEYGEEL